MARVRTGSIHRLPSGKWLARYTGPDGKRHGKAFLTKRDAKAWLQQIYSDISAGKLPRGDTLVVITFGDYAERWLADRKVKGRPLADRTREQLPRSARPLHPPHLRRPADPHDHSRRGGAWYDRTAVNCPTYRARAYSLLRSILASAVDDGYLLVNPARIRGAGQAKRRQRSDRPRSRELECSD